MSKQPAYRFPFAKYPAIRIAVFFAAGIVAGSYYSIDILYWGTALGAVMVIGIIAEFILRCSLNVTCFYVSVSCYCAALLLFGATWFNLFEQTQEHPSARLLSAYTWQSVDFSGTIQSIDPTSSGNYMMDVSVNTTTIQDSLQWPNQYLLRTYYDQIDSTLLTAIKPGAEIKFKATIYPLEKIRNPGDFKYKQYLASLNIYTHAGIDTVYAVRPGTNRFSWNWLQQNVLQLIEKNFNEQTAGLAKSLLIGYKNELSQDTKTAFSRVGLAHIMAVSGMNVVYILAPFWLLIPFLWTLRFGKQFGLGLMILILVVFAGLTGFSASVMRACITGGFITYGRIFNKARNSKNLTAVAAIIILLLNPADLFDIGFQLSFAAVYIILFILPVIQNVIPDCIQYRWYGIPVMAAIVTLVVQAGLYPILSYYFHEFSLIAPLANAVVVPFLGLLVPYALFLLLVTAFFPAAGFVLNAPCRWFLEFLQWFTTHLAGWQWSWVQTPSTGFLLFFIWIAAFFVMASVRIPKLRWKMVLLLLISLCTQQTYSLYQVLQPSTLKVTILDVGQGDAAFVATPSGKHFLIDVGRWSPGYNSGNGVILPFLKAKGVHKLDAIFLSHPHADHIGGMVALIGKIPIGAIYHTGFSYDSDLYKNYLREAAQYDIAVKELHAGDVVFVDPAMRLWIYGPAAANYSSDPNEHSLIIEIIYGETQFLFMGDAGSYQEHRLVQNYRQLIDTDFLKVGHHGSKTSSTVSFLNVATPQISSVSLAKNNRFGHPDIQAVRRLRWSGTNLYFTSLNGALKFVSDGYAIKRKKWR